MKEPKFVEVEWADAISTADWRDDHHLPAVVKCTSRGWLLIDDDEQVTLAGTLQEGDDGHVGEIVSIPRGMVKRIRRLKVSYGR